jgi:hypothetical protein
MTAFILVGMESDGRNSFTQHADEYRSQGVEPVPTSKREVVARMIGTGAYIECSARLMYNIDEVFETGVKAAMHALSQFQPALMSCAIHGDSGGMNELILLAWEILGALIE